MKKILGGMAALMGIGVIAIIGVGVWLYGNAKDEWERMGGGDKDKKNA